VHANRLKLGNKGYKFRPLETSKSITMQVAEIAQAAHDGTISLQLARTLLYSVQIGAPYVSRSGGYSGDVETELTPAMATASLRNDDVSSEPCGTDIPVRHESDENVMDAEEVLCTADTLVRDSRAAAPDPAQVSNHSSATSTPSRDNVANEAVTTTERCHPERGCIAEPKDPFRSQPTNPVPALSSHESAAPESVESTLSTIAVSAASSINNDQSPISNPSTAAVTPRSSDHQIASSSDAPKPPQPARGIYDPVGCLAFLTSEGS